MAISLVRRSPSKITTLVTILGLIVFLPFLFYGVYQTVTLITRAVGYPANIVVDASVTLESIRTDFYHAFAQGGEEAEDMIGPVFDETKALEPKIIRLDHIYDHYDVVSGGTGNPTFNFSKLDTAIETITKLGAIPLLSLSYMPASIAKDSVIINPPNDWNDWAKVVQRTIEHYSGKSEKNLNGVWYEVWNEPDLDQFGKWKIGGDKNYLTLYQYAAIGAKNAGNVNSFYLGGPSTTGLYKNWITALANSGYRVDFFSWHTYLSDPRRFLTDQQNFSNWLLPYPQHASKPSMITEFGFTGAKNNLYSTTYAAAHTASVIRQLISGGPKYLFSFEIKDGPGQEAGNGWGVIAHQNYGKTKKPRYHVYSFIDEMAGKRLQLNGEGSWVTGFATLNNGIYRLLLVNFDANGTHTETVPITFKNLPAGSYTYTERSLFGKTSETTVTSDGKLLQKNVILPVQSIVIIKLTRK